MHSHARLLSGKLCSRFQAQNYMYTVFAYHISMSTFVYIDTYLNIINACLFCFSFAIGHMCTYHWYYLNTSMHMCIYVHLKSLYICYSHMWAHTYTTVFEFHVFTCLYQKIDPGTYIYNCACANLCAISLLFVSMHALCPVWYSVLFIPMTTTAAIEDMNAETQHLDWEGDGGVFKPTGRCQRVFLQDVWWTKSILVLAKDILATGRCQYWFFRPSFATSHAGIPSIITSSRWEPKPVCESITLWGHWWTDDYRAEGTMMNKRRASCQYSTRKASYNMTLIGSQLVLQDKFHGFSRIHHISIHIESLWTTKPHERTPATTHPCCTTFPGLAKRPSHVTWDAT